MASRITRELQTVLTFPFRGDGPVILGIGTVFFWFVTGLSYYSRYGFIASTFVAGFLCAYFMRSLSAVAGGDDDPPDWPDFTDWMDGVLVPFATFAVTALIAFSPAIVCGYFVEDLPREVLWALVAFGSLYLPMALLSVSLHHSVIAANPITILMAVARVPGPYVVAFLGVAIAVAVYFGIAMAIGGVLIVGGLVSGFAALYSLLAVSCSLGRMYRNNAGRLGWFE